MDKIVLPTPNAIDAKLEFIQKKIEAVHADIKSLLPRGVSFVNSDIPALHSPSTSLTINGCLQPHAATLPIGRRSRHEGSNVTTGPVHGGGAACLSPAAPPSPGGNADAASGRALRDGKPMDAPSGLDNRRKMEAVKQKMQEFVKPMLLPQEMEAIPELRSAPCSWLLSIALACSYVSGENITIEDVLRHNRLGLHYVSFPSVTLAELFDMTNEFLTNHAKMQEAGVQCEVAMFDAETLEELVDMMGVGEPLQITTLSQFRKELSRVDSQSIYVVNFDPYLIEQHEIRMRLNYLEMNEVDCESTLIVPRWSAKNQGTFALILSFVPALQSVTLGSPILLEDGRITIKEHTVPVQTLYKALVQKDLYCNRSRGFVRIFVRDTFAEKVSSIFPLNVLDGSLTGGLLTTALDTAIAPHILGLSLMHHLVTTTILDGKKEEHHGGTNVCYGNLHGIPVTLVCQELGLGIATIVGGSSKASVPSAFSWYSVLLKKLAIDDAVALGVVLVSRRGGAEDGPVNIADDVFMSHIQLAVDTGSVMLLGFDVNIALNVKVDNRSEPCHFAIAIGLDQGRGFIRLADVNVKKYRKTWHVPVTRLYSAVIGYGYIIAAKSQKTIDKLDAKAFKHSILSEARYSLSPAQRLLRFEYPKKNYVVTILADAFDRLGYRANVESVVNNSGFHLSFMLSEHLPLENAATVARNYSHNHLSDSVSVATRHMDNGASHTNIQNLLTQVRFAVQSPKSRCLIVNFQASYIYENKAVWNGGHGGSYAIVIDYDEKKSLVTLSDANHESFYRTWVCPLEILFNAICAMDPIALRARGTLLLTATSQEDLYVGCYGYDMSHSLIHHPFKPSVWPAFHCLALVASEMCYGVLSSTKGVPYSAEDFLYSMPSFSVYRVPTNKLDCQTFVGMANTAFEQLKIALEAKVVNVTLAGSFLNACREDMVNGKPVTTTLLGYDTQPIHCVAGFSVGVINRVRDEKNGGTVQIIEGNSCTFGSVWESPATKLQHAVTAIVRISRRPTAQTFS